MRGITAVGIGIALAWAMPAGARSQRLWVDSVHGDDRADGRSPRRAWRTLARATRDPIAPGTTVLLVAGSVWREPLIPRGSGVAGRPIRFLRHGRGAMPRIDVGDIADAGIALINVGHITVSGIEVVNRGTGIRPRNGVRIVADNGGELHDITVSDLYIHDVNGSNDVKDSGGILFRTLGKRRPSRFVGLRIERNLLWKVDRTAIVGHSDRIARRDWFPSTGVVIRDNFAEDIGGDGIVPWATAGALVEHNVVRQAVQRAPGYNAAIWQWSTDDTVIRLNEASATRGTLDGQGYDSDYNSRDTRIEYNYSGDNAGGFVLVCTPVRRDDAWNIGNRGTIVRRNISVGDHSRIFHVAGADDVLIDGNAVYTAPGEAVQMLLLSAWDGWSRGVRVTGNLLHANGPASYGHERSRDTATGLYAIAPGWGPAREVRLSGNRYAGPHALPDRDTATGAAPAPVRIDAPPAFDPAHPERFARFRAAHRRWLIATLRRQFGVSAEALYADAPRRGVRGR